MKPAGIDKKDLLFVIGSLDLGGAERHVAQLVPRLQTLGWRPTVYCIGRAGRQAEAVRQAGIDVISPPIELSLVRGGRLIKALGLVLSALKLAALFVTRRPAVAHFFLPAAYLIGAPLALLARVPITVMSRRSLNVYQDDHPLARRLEPHLHKRMSAILANSERVRQQLIDEEGCAPDHVGLIYNGVDTDRFRPASNRARLRESLGIPEAAFVITILANLIAYKGHADLFEALAQIKTRLPSPWALHCIGRDDGQKDALIALADKHGLSENIRFLGEQSDVASQLAAADMATLPSHQEGFANAILEAMACGLPVVASDVGGNSEAVADGETGSIVPPHDPAALAEAIIRIAGDATQARAMGRAGRVRAEKVFSLESSAQAYDDFYAGLLRDL